MKRCKRNLQSIDISGCVEISDEAIQLLARDCGGLQNMGFAHLRLLTDTGIRALAENLWIEELNISHCQRITDEGTSIVCIVCTSSLD